LTVPLRVLLDAHRPIAPLLSDAAAALSPMLTTLGMRGIAGLLADPERTAARLEALIAEPEPRPGTDTCRTSGS
jgi:hypothetical protein